MSSDKESLHDSESPKGGIFDPVERMTKQKALDAAGRISAVAIAALPRKERRLYQKNTGYKFVGSNRPIVKEKQK